MPERHFTVIFEPSGKRVQVDEDTTLLEAAQLVGERIRSVCGGKGTCGKCKITVAKGKVSTSPRFDPSLLTAKEISEGYHLACQTRVVDEVEAVIPLESRIGGQQILTQAVISKVDLDPLCRKYFIEPELLPGRLDPEPLVRTIQKKYSMSVNLTDSVRLSLDDLKGWSENGVTVTACQINNNLQIGRVEVGNTSERNYGLAIDVGTTKVALYLVNLNDGTIIDTGSEYNRQLLFGEDLLSRIDYAFRKKGGLRKLQNAVVDTINSLTEEITSKNNIEIGDINDITIAGNTVMTYLIVGIDPSHLAQSKAPVSRDPVEVKAESLGIKANANTWVFCLPNVSRFVGGDAIGDVLTSGLFDSSEISVLIDMGTNGEVIIGCSGWLFSTSCAAGPAFEGWGIKFGMRSVEGAIEHIKIDKENLRSSYTVIGDSSMKPRGICGSGLIDAMAEMFGTGILDSLGKIRKMHRSSMIREGAEGLEYLVVPAEETDIERDIVITQKDIDNLVDSKAAACAAVAVLMKKVGITVLEVDNLYLAGAFGIYMDTKSATTVGVFPEFPNAEVVALGNGSVAGSYLTLLSTKKRERAVEIADLMTYYDLTTDPDFMEEYSAALLIPGRTDLFPSRQSAKS
ncbi:MAG: DUF4445 domain-containing protein [Nitrososphaeria archaeon]|nr:DUF4445 domain-containing protein [Nitrososphaeria archaeon]NIN51581.1 DUF4445 domain-containing protein [Nitrososphaeria archaeon]NIQ32066.1 DUF4445 domain-containing protein [Nitrososphaeria archaeon]